jgi:ribose transport system permease protein
MGGGDINVSEGFAIPVSLPVILITYFLAYLFLQYTRTGRHIYAIGGNPQAARVSGINVDRTLVLVYGLCGLLAGFSGLLLAGRTNSGFPNAGLGQELDAISAVIIGGASFFGGRGRVLGIFAGALVIGLMRNILNLRDVPVFWQQVLIGVVIITVVYLDVLRRRAGSSNA